MLVITHIRLNGRGRFYESIEAVQCESVDSVLDTTTPLGHAMSVAHVIAAIRSGTEVVTSGEPQVAVEVFEAYGTEYIRSANEATATNDLLSLPKF